MSDSPAPERIAPATIDAVLDWFEKAARTLPWREPDATAWAILVSEIMLQQTPVSRVLPRWQEWMQRWPTPADLAAAPTSEVLRAWDRLGYPRRALRLHECATEITTHYGGQVPTTLEQLRALPGIGEYTAAAIMAFAYRERALVLDTNIRRVLARWLCGTALPAAHLSAAERRNAAAILPDDPERSAQWNQAVMELGALVCTARSPRCEQCPLQPWCRWYAAGSPPVDPHITRRVQRFEGTDRQLRGQIMAVLREHGAASTVEIARLDPSDPQRVERCVNSLVADGLARPTSSGLALP